MEVVPVAISLMRTVFALGAGLWFWVSAAVEFGVVFGVVFGGRFGVWLAFSMRFWLALFDWSMLLPMLLPNCSLLMWRTTAVALKACWYVERWEFMVKKKAKRGPKHTVLKASQVRFCFKIWLYLYKVAGLIHNVNSTYSPFAFCKVFAHLSTDGLMDILAECSVSWDPEKQNDKVKTLHPCSPLHFVLSSHRSSPLKKHFDLLQSV